MTSVKTAERQGTAGRRSGGAGRWTVAGMMVAAWLGLAADVSSDAQASKPVITVGDSSITVGEMQAHIAQVPVFQLRTIGKTPEELRRNFAEQLVSIELMVEGARQDGLDKRSDVNDRIRAVLRSALLAQIRRDVSNGDVTIDEVRQYYEANKERYQSPLRIKIWQIQVKTKEEAEALLETIKSDEAFQKDPVAGWEKLAREQSTDKSSAMRRGNVGFVEPNGATAQRGVKVDPALYKAASTVQDGQIVSAPVQVADGWAVVQRRGSHGPVMRSLATEALTIRNTLAKDRMQQRLNELLAALRRKHVQEQHDEHVDKLEMTPEGELGSKQRPGILKRQPHAARGAGRPHGHPGHMR